MAKFNIPFDGVDYLIDESALAAATAELQSHFSTVMSGSGETITLNGISYNVDSTKLTTAKNDFVSHLGTIAGNGSKVKVNGVEYPVDTAKVSDATAELHAVLGGMISGGGEEEDTIAAGLYETGSNYTVMLTSWEDLLADGSIVVNNGEISVGTVLPDNLPELNEYGFYYDFPYRDEFGYGIAFHEDGSIDEYYGDEIDWSYPASTAAYSIGHIDLTDWGWCVMDVSSDGTMFVDTDGYIYGVGSKAQLAGDLMLPNDGSVTVIIESAFGNQINLTGVTIPDSVTTIGGFAFYNCPILNGTTYDNAMYLGNANNPYIVLYQAINTSIASCDINENTKFICNNAFTDCSNLAYIIIPNGVTTIDYNTFAGCTSLTSIEIPDSVTTISGGAFQGCTSLTSITIPNGVTTIGSSAFYECTSLANVAFGENSQLTTIGGWAFEYCRALTSITIPEGVTSIGEEAFCGCSALTSITFGENSQLTTIGNYAFSGCSSLASITFGENSQLTTIGNRVFADCRALTSITIPEGVTSIGEQAFGHCTALTSIEIPEGVTTISGSMFYSCKALTSVTIPASVTTISDYAFYYCENLADITFEGTVAQWNAITFEGDYYWKYYVPATTVQCSDGTVQL